ncbi:MAG: S-layer homology domain-containing protein [Clostridiales bacterium]|nr:S-layer homology domain-containing protein [Clostridiales bacterium]
MKQRNIRSRVTAWLLAVLMVMGVMVFAPVSSFAAEPFSDISSHWAKANIEYLVKKQILSGYPDGTFKPENTVKRAEFIKMLDATFGLNDTIAINYSDVKSSDWFYPYIQQAAAQGYLLDYGTALDPEGKLTREEASALLARYLNLSPDNKAAPGTFSDYMAISSQYREYVLQCVAAGILKGYDDGEFKPQRTLTRAEALAILYRSAGTIYRTSANGTDADAASANASVTAGNVTITNASNQGSVYVTEGASTGTVKFSGSNIRGTLFLRGTVRLELDNTKVENIVVMSADDHISGITLMNNSTIENIRLDSAASVYMNGGTGITNMTVSEHAEGSLVDGSGKLGSVDIRGARFVSNIIPVNYKISGNLTATINGAVVTGSDVSTDGLAKGTKAVIDTTGSRDVLTLTPDQTSVLFYYYTNTATAPTADTFSSFYNNANSTVKGYNNLDVVKQFSLNLISKSVADQYKYVVVALFVNQKYFTPILVPRDSGSTDNSAAGFSKGPTVTTNSSTGYDTLTFTTNQTGYVFYYYTTSNAPINSETFVAKWNAAGSGLKNPTNTGISAVSGIESNQTTVYNGGASSQYQYDAVMLVTGSGSSARNYPPIIVTRNAGSGDDHSAAGFNSAPVWSSYSGSDTIKVSTKFAGTLRYYYTNSSQALTTQSFNAYYGIGTYYNSITVNAGENAQTYLTYMTGTGTTAQSVRIDTAAANTAGLNYIALQLNDNLGNSYPPIVIARSESPSGGAGFSAGPTITVNTGGDFINYTPSMTGIVFWYYSKTSSGIDASNFMTGWSSANTSVKGNTQQVNAGQAYNQKTADFGYADGYTFIVIAIQSDGKIQKPAILNRLNTNAGSYGFSVNPVVMVSNLQNGVDTVSFTPTYAGILQFYYTNNQIAPNDYTTFTSNYNTAAYKGTFSTAANQAVTNASTGIVSANATARGFQYVTFMLTGTTGTTTYYSPITVKRGDLGNVTGSGFTTTPTVIPGAAGTITDTFNAFSSISGTVYWYYTTSSMAPANSASFLEIYNRTSSPFSGTFNVNSVGYGAQATYVRNFGFVAFMLAVPSALGNTTYYTPVVVPRTGSGVGTGNGITYGPYINPGQTQDNVNLTTGYTGTLKFYYSATNPGTIAATLFDSNYSQAGLWGYAGNISVTANAPVNFNINVPNNSLSYIVFMLESGGNKYTPFTVQRTSGGGGNYTSYGFSRNPTVSTTTSGSSVYDTISFQPSVSGKVYYYYSNNSNETDQNIKRYGLSRDVNTSVDTFTRLLSTSESSCRYIWFILSDGVGDYKKYAVTRDSGSGTTPPTNPGIGFTTDELVLGDNKYLTVKPQATGSLYYYTTTSSTSPSDSAAYLNNFEGIEDPHKGIIPVTKDETHPIDLSEFDKAKDKYIVFMLLSSSPSKFYTQKAILIPYPPSP